MKRFCGLPLLASAFLFVFSLGFGATFAASLKGKVKNHVYSSPANNFTVPVPSGTFQKWMQVEDNFSGGGGPGGLPVGVVSFHDDTGELVGIHYTMIPDQAMARLSAPDTREAALKGWLHEVAMPFWYLRVSPKSQIINEEMGTFEDMPVLLAVVVVPEASSVLITATQKRMNSRRGLIIFPRGQFVYMLSTETVTAIGLGRGDEDKSTSTKDWKEYVDGLKNFYRSIVFTTNTGT